MSSPNGKIHMPRRYLEDNYEPHPNDVLIGRGRRVETHNVKYRAMINYHLAAYLNAQTKGTKSGIILRIFHMVKRGGGVGFVKREASSRRWYAIEDPAARVSIAQAFRDALNTEYKSSKLYKQQRRQEERGEREVETLTDLLDETPISGHRDDPMSLLSLRPPSLVPMVSSTGSDLSPCASLSAVLENTNLVLGSADGGAIWRTAPLQAFSRPQDDLLAGLEHAVASEMDMNSNPFEPTPLKEVPPDDFWFTDSDNYRMDPIPILEGDNSLRSCGATPNFDGDMFASWSVPPVSDRGII